MENRFKKYKKQEKKSYKKPEIRQVQLKPEEAVLGGCKIAGTAGSLQASCTSPTICSAPES